jgi:hypothetical protein
VLLLARIMQRALFVADWQRKHFHFRLIAHDVARPWSTTVVRAWAAAEG